MNTLKIIGGGITALLMGVVSFLGIHQVAPAPTTPTLGAFNPSGGGTYRLQTSLGTTDTTIRLSSFKEPISNTPYTMSYLNTAIAYGTLDPQQPTRSEFISFTGITQNGDGTVALTGVTRGLGRSYPYTASSTLAVSHSGQSIFILSDSPSLFNEYATKRNAQTITGAWTFASTAPALYDGSFTVASSSQQIPPASWIFSNFIRSTADTTVTATTTFSKGLTSSILPSAPTDVVNKAYADALAISGSPNASLTAKGISEEATTAEINSGTQLGSTGAELFINPFYFATSNYANQISKVSTTTVNAMATTSITIPNLPNIEITIIATSTAASGNTNKGFTFNNDTTTAYSWVVSESDGVSVTSTSGNKTAYSQTCNTCSNLGDYFLHINLTNRAGTRKVGTFSYSSGDTANGAVGTTGYGAFTWSNTATATSWQFRGTTKDIVVPAGSFIQVTGY